MNQDLDILKEFYHLSEEAFNALARTIFKALDTVCAQSSAAVENVNSFIRPFLENSRDQISQQTLNLIMFFFNNRVFRRGKRKGFSPWQLLSGQSEQKDPIELLVTKIKCN